MDEAQVKAAVLARVRASAKRQRKPLVTAEFSLGSSGVRADMAVFGTSTTTGFEIKTAKDTLRRLPAQMEAYARYFNHSVAIIAPRHLGNVKSKDLCGASLWTYDSAGSLIVVRQGIFVPVSDCYLTDVLTQAERRKSDFRSAIEARYGATSRRFWSATSRRSIRVQDLPLLSRFSDIRTTAREFVAARDARWREWLAAQEILAPELA